MMHATRKSRKTLPSKAMLKRAICGCEDAGVVIGSIMIEPDGTIRITPAGVGAPADAANDVADEFAQLDAAGLL